VIIWASLSVAFRYAQIRSRINRLSGDEHLKIYVRADSDSSSSNNTKFLACRDGFFAFSKRWGGHPQVAVDGNEAFVLHQDFESAWTLSLDTDHSAGRSRHDRRARWCCQIDAIMVRARLGMVRKHARTKRRGDARGTEGWHKHRFGLGVRVCAA
jgi:hypothetical protein